VLEPKTQMETEKIGSFNNPNKKRVTINYKGKIKLPTDSLSKDYEKRLSQMHEKTLITIEERTLKQDELKRKY